MKFRLFGGLDCSDFLLVQLAAIAMIGEQDVVEHLTDHAVGVIVANPSASAPDELNAELFSLSSLKKVDQEEVMKAAVGVHALVSSIARYSVPHDVAVNEMTMLGLTKEAAEIIAATSTKNLSKMRASLATYHTPLRPGLAVPQPHAATVWRNDQSGETLVSVPFVKTRAMDADGHSQELTVDMSPEQLRAFLGELVIAREALKQAVQDRKEVA